MQKAHIYYALKNCWLSSILHHISPKRASKTTQCSIPTCWYA